MNRNMWTSRRLIAIGMVVLLIPHILWINQPFGIDESATWANVVHFFEQQTLIPVHTKYPTLYSYVAAPAIGLQALILWARGWFADLSGIVPVYLADPWTVMWPARVVTLLCLAACAYGIGRYTGRRYGREAGICAGGLLLALPGLLRYGSLALPDVLTMMLTTFAFVAATHVAERPHAQQAAWRPLVLGGVLAGLATASKYNGAVAAIPLIAAVVWPFVADRQRPTASFWKQGAGLAGSGIGGFLLGCPGWVLAPEVMWKGLRYELQHAAEGHLGFFGLPLLGQLERMLWTDAFLLVLFVGVIVSAVVERWRRGRLDVDQGLALALIAGTFALAFVSAKQSFHYLFPCIPAIVFLAARHLRQRPDSTAQSEGAFFQRLPVPNRPRMWAAIGLILVPFLVSVSASLDRLHPHAEDVARSWMYRHVPENSAVVLDCWAVPQLNVEKWRARLTHDMSRAPDFIRQTLREHPEYRAVDLSEEIAYDPDRLQAAEAEYIVTSPVCYNRYFEEGWFTSRFPSPSSPMWDTHKRRQHFYEYVLHGEKWTVMHRVDTGNGQPVVFLRKADAS